MIGTTNVKDLPHFTQRRKKVMVDGIPDDGFFASEFTLAEMGTGTTAIATIADLTLVLPLFSGTCRGAVLWREPQLRR